MPKKTIGHMSCPECGHPEAEVNEDKNGHAYRFCPECTAQYFTRGGDREKQLRARYKPLAPPAVAAPQAPAAKPEPEKSDAKPVPKSGSIWEQLYGKQA